MLELDARFDDAGGAGGEWRAIACSSFTTMPASLRVTISMSAADDVGMADSMGGTDEAADDDAAADAVAGELVGDGDRSLSSSLHVHRTPSSTVDGAAFGGAR